MTLALGTYLHHNRYQITDRLGQGGMGAVYLATDQNFPGIMVAIKENTMAAIPYQRQFEYEAGLLRQLNHPNLARVTNYFIEPGGRQYLVMDYIAGNDLMQKLLNEKQPQAENDVLRWMDSVLDAIAYMHAWRNPHTGQTQPILHRDIKPSNIKRTPNDDIFLVDFGLAKSEQALNTMTGARGVTPGFSPIEQYDGGTTTRSDIYALGATMYMLLTNNRLPTAVEIAGGKQLIAPRNLNPEISRHAERVMLNALQLQATDRYVSVNEMRSDLSSNNRMLGRLPDLRPASKPKTSKRAKQRRTKPHHARRTRATKQPLFLRVVISTLLIAIVGLFGYVLLSQYFWNNIGPEQATNAIMAENSGITDPQNPPDAGEIDQSEFVSETTNTVSLQPTIQLTRSVAISTEQLSLPVNNGNYREDNLVGATNTTQDSLGSNFEDAEEIAVQKDETSTTSESPPILFDTVEPVTPPIVTKSPTVTPFPTETSTRLPTDTPTRRPTVTKTPTQKPTSTSTTAATETAKSTSTSTSIPPTRRPTSTPTPTQTSTPTETAAPPTSTSTATAVPPTSTPTPTNTPTPTRYVPQLTIGISSLNIRSGPGSDYGIVGAAKQQEGFAITGHAYGCAWYEIQHPQLATAWVSGGAQYVSTNLASCDQVRAAAIPPTPVSPTATFTPPPPTATFTPIPPRPTPVPQQISTPAGNNGSLPRDKGCYQLQNQLGVNLTITITNLANGQTVTSFVVPVNGQTQHCLNPGQYQVAINGPLGWAAFNTTINVAAGNHVVFPLSLRN